MISCDRLLTVIDCFFFCARSEPTTDLTVEARLSRSNREAFEASRFDVVIQKTPFALLFSGRSDFLRCAPEKRVAAKR